MWGPLSNPCRQFAVPGYLPEGQDLGRRRAAPPFANETVSEQATHQAAGVPWMAAPPFSPLSENVDLQYLQQMCCYVARCDISKLDCGFACPRGDIDVQTTSRVLRPAAHGDA